jgi:hypothetical protein
MSGEDDGWMSLDESWLVTEAAEEGEVYFMNMALTEDDNKEAQSCSKAGVKKSSCLSTEEEYCGMQGETRMSKEKMN